jgi:ferredoxin--NADP+ reductase
MSEPRLGTADRPLRVAIIGSGPSGFYAAEALQKREDVVVQVDMFDRLPTPFGLVRGGVAPDHQKIKSVTKAYDRIAEHPEFRFYGNVEFGRDLVHDDVMAYFHAVVYAVGSRGDRRLGIRNDHLPGSHGAAEFVGWYNGHPDFRRLSFDLSARTAAVIGNGNVAMDVVRILGSSPKELRATDMADYAVDRLSRSAIEEIYILGRRGPAQAAFTVKELRELGQLERVDVIVDPADLELDEATRSWMAANPDRARDKVLETLAEYAATPPQGRPRRIIFRFRVSPVEIFGEERVEGLRLVRNVLQAADDESLRARPTDEHESLGAELVFRAIGYRGTALPGVAFDENAGVIPNAEGRVLDDGEVRVGEYCVGWIKRGPSGVIGTNKPDAAETVARLFEDYDSGLLERADTIPSRAVLEQFLAERSDIVSYRQWQILDELERRRGVEAGDRPREKFVSIEQMLGALAEHSSDER